MTQTDKDMDVLKGTLTETWQGAAKKLIDLAEAIPEDKFDVQLVAGARNCGEVLRHVAFWNRFVAASLKGEHPDGSANELPQREYPHRGQVLSALRASCSEVTAALGAHNVIVASTLLQTIGMAIEHACEHYGQLAVYARIAGVIPPASRA